MKCYNAASSQCLWLFIYGERPLIDGNTRIARLGNPGWIYQADNYLVETLCETADGGEAAWGERQPEHTELGSTGHTFEQTKVNNLTPLIVSIISLIGVPVRKCFMDWLSLLSEYS